MSTEEELSRLADACNLAPDDPGARTRLINHCKEALEVAREFYQIEDVFLDTSSPYIVYHDIFCELRSPPRCWRLWRTWHEQRRGGRR